MVGIYGFIIAKHNNLDLPISFYFLPGGHVEHGESAHVAVLRELLEEADKLLDALI